MTCNVLGVSWTTPTITWKRALIPGVAVLLDGLWLLEGALSAQMRKFHLNHIGIFIHRPMCIVGFFKDR